MSDQHAESTSRTIRDKVLKCITEHPGSVVFRDDIIEATGLTEIQITGTIGRLKADGNPIADDIEVVVPGRAWRYIPNPRVRRAVRGITGSETLPGEPDRRLPLTRALREYFMANPGKVIYADELRKVLSPSHDLLEFAQIRVGVVNAKQNNQDFKRCMTTVVPGRAWMYTPQPSSSSVETVSPTPPTSSPTSPAPSSPPPPTEASSLATDNELLILEKLAVASDGSILVRDENKELYRLTKM